jgi:branched-subunit amino acid aminotransferase/4-amino-4-deoxychorismate lyase
VAEDDITRAAEHLVGHNAALLTPEQDLALVLVATPGPIGYYLGQAGGAGDGPPTFLMHTFPLLFHRYRRLFEQGARLVIPQTRHIPAQCLDPRVKQRSRMHWWIAEQEAHQLDPGASALLLDLNGHVTETATANLLVVTRGVVETPPRHTVLDGVSLGVVEGLCGELGVPFCERPLTPYDCLTADEAMLSCTSYCLAPVASVNGAPLRCPGPVFEAVLRRWSETVGVGIREQILSAPDR